MCKYVSMGIVLYVVFRRLEITNLIIIFPDNISTIMFMCLLSQSFGIRTRHL